MRKAKSSARPRGKGVLAPPAELAQAAAALGAISAGPAPVGPVKATRIEGQTVAEFMGTRLEAGPAPARAGGREESPRESKRPRQKRK